MRILIVEDDPRIAKFLRQDLEESRYRAVVADTTRSGTFHVGLGLSLADWIVRAHEDSIQVESHLGVGTVVRVILSLVVS